MSAAGWMWARSLLRGNWRATLFLALFAGLAGGAVLTAVEVNRRTTSAYSRYREYARPADLVVFGCPRGFTMEEVESAGLFLTDCISNENTAEIRDGLLDQPEVESSSRGAIGIVGVADETTPSGYRPHLTWMEFDPGPGLLLAEPLIVEGREPDEQRADEVAINEAMASYGGYEVGDEISLRPFRLGQLFDVGVPTVPPEGPPATVTITGIVRMPDDLQPSRPAADIPGAETRDTVLYTTPAWWAAYGPDVATYGRGALVHLDTAVTTADEFVASLTERFPDRVISGNPAVSDSEPVEEVIDHQAGAVLIVTIVAALASLVFVAEALRRQVTRELSMQRTLSALGLTRRDITTAVIARCAPVAAAAAVLAVLAAVLLSPLGPVGLARSAEPSLGMRADWPVLLIGFVAVVVLVLALAAWAARAALRRPAQRRTPRAGLTGSLPAPPTARTGLLLVRTRGTMAAILCAAIAVAAAVGTSAFNASIRDLHEHPRRFGVSWTVSLGEYADIVSFEQGREQAEAIPGVIATGGLRSSVVDVDGEEVVAVAFHQLNDPLVGPVVLEGRAPTTADEIALGVTVMRALDVDVGDTIDRYGEVAGPIEIVGRIVANDAGIDSTSPGRMAVVVDELLDAGAPFTTDESPQYVLAVLDPDADRDALFASLTDEFGRFISPPIPQAQIRNLDLIRPALTIAAGVIVVLAVGALAHALVSTIRSRRRDLAIVRGLGLTRAQVAGGVAWDALMVALAAATIGIPAGVITANVAWRWAERGLGIDSPPVTPLLGVFLVVAAAFVLANLVTLATAQRASRLSPAEVLRSE